MHGTAAVYPSARIWAPWNLEMGARSALGDDVECYNVDKVTLGEDAVASQQAFLCTASHDISDPGKRLITAPIQLRPLSWVCARAFIHPGVTLHEGAVAGAGSVVTKDVAAWTVVAGNPATFVKRRFLPGSSPDGGQNAS
jgi:putative colanic acid biosynthesis acetyltransferase WcaF